MEIHVFGDRRFIATMRAAGVDVDRLNRAHKEAADIAAAAGRTAAPKVSGRLAKSIRTSATRKAGVVRAGRKSVPYAMPIHWGWKARNIKAQPFLSRGAQASEPRWIEVYKKHLNDIVNDVEGA